MKVQTKPIFVTLMAAMIGLTMSGCGKSNSNDSNSIYSQNGGFPGVYPPTGGQVSGQCAPITGPIPFTVQNAYLDFANLIGGQIPFSQAVGTMYIGGGGGGQFNGSGSDGTISMNLVNAGYAQQGYQPYSGYPQQSQYGYSGQMAYGGSSYVSGGGQIQLSQLVIQDIVYKVQTGQIQIGMNMQQYPQQYPQQYGYPQYGQQINPQQICVSAIAMNIGRYNNTLYGGSVYLYLNGSSRGYIMRF